MRFLCIVHHDESWFDTRTPEQMKELDRDSMAYDKALEARRQLVVAEALQNSRTAKLVRVRGKKPTVTDGPFAEAKEVLGGYWMIDVPSRAEAIEWAKRCPMGDNEIIEIRQVQEMDDYTDDVRKAAEGFDDLKRSASGRR